MKKTYLVLFAALSLSLLFSIPVPASADLCVDTQATGIVPCGVSVDSTGVPTCRCELGHLFLMALRVYNFIVLNIAAPLAAILIVAGGIMFILAGGNPNLAGKGKELMKGAAWGILLILGSWVIVDLVLKAIGYTGTWSSISF